VIAFRDRDIDAFASKLADELSVRLRPGTEAKPGREKARDAAVARALDHVRASGSQFGKGHKIGLVKRLLITRAFQRNMNERGFEGSFIKDATLTLIRALTPAKS
jgi:hypothetical protein